MESQASSRNHDISLPQSYWGILSSDDKAEFLRLRSQFLQGQKISSKDRRIVTFRKELIAVLRFIERNEIHAEERSVLVGVCFAGPFICVNTRQLKNFLGRCKSSINGSFQQMGYVALRTKAKARSCVIAVMPSLQHEPNILRQWTVRCASNEAHFCFISSFSNVTLPEITAEDLYDDKRVTNATTISRIPISLPSTVRSFPSSTNHVSFPSSTFSTKFKQIDDDLVSLEDSDMFEKVHNSSSTLSMSQSMDLFTSTSLDSWDYHSTMSDSTSLDWDSINTSSNSVNKINRSSSAYLLNNNELYSFEDF